MAQPKKYDVKNIALLINPKSMLDLTSTSGDHFGVINLRFVDTTDGLDKLQWISDYTSTGLMFNNLRFRAQWNRDRKDRGVYGWQLHIDNADVNNSRTAEAHLYIMRKIEKVREGFPVRPETFGQFVTLLCLGLGIKTFLRVGERKTGVHSWSSLHEYYYDKNKVGDDLQTLIDREIDQTYFPEERQRKEA
jgi:hypothetical protein